MNPNVIDQRFYTDKPSPGVSRPPHPLTAWPKPRDVHPTSDRRLHLGVFVIGRSV